MPDPRVPPRASTARPRLDRAGRRPHGRRDDRAARRRGVPLDVGSWYRADRATQATADAAALAGAQELIAGTSAASALADTYAVKNGGGDVEVSFGTRVLPDDLITLEVARPAPAFTKLFGIDSVEVHARATARAGIPGKARYVAPIAVNEHHPMLECRCFDESTQVTLQNLHNPGGGDAAGAFGLLNLNSAADPEAGDIGAGTLADWILNGYQDALPLGTYRSSPSTEFNSQHIRDALNSRLGSELLFPVYRSITGGGSQAEYEIIGWVGFVPSSFTINGNSSTIRGAFTKVVWQGLATTPGRSRTSASA
jgi:hypothetical protein